MVTKALSLNADAVIIDLQDAVPAQSKDSARASVAKAVSQPSAGSARYIRIRPGGDSELRGDMSAAVGEGVEGVVVPLVDDPDSIAEVDNLLQEMEAKKGLPHGGTLIVAMIESAKGTVNAARIAAASNRMTGLMFGAEDYALDLGLPAATSSGTLDYARAAIVVAAASEGIQAIDRVYTDFRDSAGLSADTKDSRNYGFSGKCVIHPSQIDVVHGAFRPADTEVADARRVVKAFEHSDVGAVAVDGKMIDAPVLARARRIIELAAR